MRVLQAPSSYFTYLLLMHLTITSTNFLYMCCFKYILCTFFLPSIPICFLANWFLSKNRRFCPRTWFPGCPTGWRRPVTLCSTISCVPPASVPRTYSIRLNEMQLWLFISTIQETIKSEFIIMSSWRKFSLALWKKVGSTAGHACIVFKELELLIVKIINALSHKNCQPKWTLQRTFSISRNKVTIFWRCDHETSIICHYMS